MPLHWSSETIKNMVVEIAGPQVNQKALTKLETTILPVLERLLLNETKDEDENHRLGMGFHIFHHFEKRLKAAVKKNRAAVKKAKAENKTPQECGYVQLDSTQLAIMLIPSYISAIKIQYDNPVFNSDAIDVLNPLLTNILAVDAIYNKSKYTHGIQKLLPQRVAALDVALSNEQIKLDTFTKEMLELKKDASASLTAIEELKAEQHKARESIAKIDIKKSQLMHSILLYKLELDHFDIINFDASLPLSDDKRNARLNELAAYAPPDWEFAPRDALVNHYSSLIAQSELHDALKVIHIHLNRIANDRIFPSEEVQIRLAPLQIKLAQMLSTGQTISRTHLADLNIYITRIVNQDIDNIRNTSRFMTKVKKGFSRAFGVFTGRAQRVTEYNNICTLLINLANKNGLELEGLDSNKARIYGYSVTPTINQPNQRPKSN